MTTKQNSASDLFSSPTQSSIFFLKSNKGKPLLVFDKYIFKCNKTTSLKKYWTCSTRACMVSIHTDLNNIFLSVTGEHDHPANSDILEVKLLKEKMKDRILSEKTSITKIYDEEISKACLSDDVTAQLPTVAEYRSNMSKARRKRTPVIPKSCIFEIPTSYQQTLTQKRFLLMDFFLKRAKDRVIVFSTGQQLSLLFNSEVIFIDGTFATTPDGFEQIFLIHVHYFGQGLPVAFCLMPNRRATTYTEVFQRLKQEAIGMNKMFAPKRIVSDFETALVAVVRQEFPTAMHSGCMFHFIQSVNRKIISLGLATDYSENTSTREQVKQLTALCLMPISEVERQFKRMQSMASSSLDDLFTYFNRQWISGNIALSMWNFHDLDHRMNNVSEGYNRRFGTRFMKNHPNVWTFIKLIQDENARFERIIIQLDAGTKSTPQSKQTTMFQRRFETLKTRFDKKEINSNQLLQGLGLLFGKLKKSK